MEILLVLICTPLVVWAIDHLFYRGELREAFVELVAPAREDRKKPRKTGRTTDA